MPVYEEDWSKDVEALGFSKEDEMLRELYVEAELSIKQIAGILNRSTWSVQRRLRLHHINLRPRGGTNNLGKRKLCDVPAHELYDMQTMDLCLKYNVHPSTVYTERRMRMITQTTDEIRRDLENCRNRADFAPGYDSPESGAHVSGPGGKEE